MPDRFTIPTHVADRLARHIAIVRIDELRAYLAEHKLRKVGMAWPRSEERPIVYVVDTASVDATPEPRVEST